MAKEEAKPTLERIYVIPLRKSQRQSPGWKKSKKAVKAIREFIQKHMKSENVKISKDINETIWKRGNRHPPARIKVIATKTEDVVKVGLFQVKKEAKVEKKEEKKEKKEEKKEEPKKEEKKEEKHEEKKPEKKEKKKKGE